MAGKCEFSRLFYSQRECALTVAPHAAAASMFPELKTG